MLSKQKFKLSAPHYRHIIPDLLIMVGSLYISVYLRIGYETYDSYLPMILNYLPIVIVVRMICLNTMGVYNILWRYVSAYDAMRIVRAVFLSTAIILAISFLTADALGRLPRSIYFIDTILVTLGMMGVRLTRRLQTESVRSREVKTGRRTLIYGAGMNGRTLAHRFRSDSTLNANVLGFVDDDTSKHKMKINNIPVLGGKEVLTEAIRRLEIEDIVVSITNAPGELLREVVSVATKFNIRPRLTSAVTNDVNSRNVKILREVNLSDLLNRPQRLIDVQSIQKLIRGKRVLVTGAGGSIGSEISRQVMGYNPSRLFLLDHSEYNLFQIDSELRSSFQSTEKVVPLLVDLKQVSVLDQLMEQYLPEIVIHAAAYKHVHLVEANPYSAILNNVQGTRNLIEACRKTDVTSFILISTDKAVNPVGVMGSTKRVCELMVTAEALETKKNYCSVRFGNVLGSSGSLIPTLQRQIDDGGPVTITHQEMTRYFMMIPEAVGLVLKASTIANPGDINILKMGDPIKIVDVARNLIALNGKTEDEIPIVFTGPRPGEKLFEELYIRGDELITEHPDILTLPWGDSKLAADRAQSQYVNGLIDKLIVAAEENDPSAIALLNSLVNTQVQRPFVDEKPEATSLRH